MLYAQKLSMSRSQESGVRSQKSEEAISYEAWNICSCGAKGAVPQSASTGRVNPRKKATSAMQKLDATPREPDVAIARMWPREIFDKKDKNGEKLLARGIDFLQRPGVYILYREEHPYYIGKGDNLKSRINEVADPPIQ
jgi:hypothetical protein